MVFANEDVETLRLSDKTSSTILQYKRNLIFFTLQPENSVNELTEAGAEVLGNEETWVSLKTGLGFYWYSRLYDNHPA